MDYEMYMIHLVTYNDKAGGKVGGFERASK